MSKTKTFFITLSIVALLAVSFFALNDYIYTEKQGVNTYEPYRATLTGVQTCLPHKDTTGPQTKECAIGMKTDAGEYYALDFSLMSQIPPVITDGVRFTASGVMTPVERLSSDHWQKYAIVGIFSVTDTVLLQTTITSTTTVVKPTPVTPKPVAPKPVAGPCYIGGCSGQICSGEKDMMSTCEFRESYACYKNTGAVCERQGNGVCGWTPSTALTACLNTANANNSNVVY